MRGCGVVGVWPFVFGGAGGRLRFALWALRLSSAFVAAALVWMHGPLAILWIKGGCPKKKRRRNT